MSLGVDNMLTTREKFGRYIDAGFPIIYLNSAEDEKCDALIKEIAGNTGIIEWNAATGFWDSKDKVREDEWQLIDVLGLVNRDQKAIEDKIIVLNNGVVNNIGTHQELLQKDEIYQNMDFIQSEGLN